VVALSVPLLGERVGRAQWWAVGAGFAGVLLIVRPGGAVFSWAVLFSLAVAVNYAAFQIITRRFAGQEHPYVTHFLTACVGTLLAGVTLPFAWTPPDWAGFGMMALLGVFGGGGHYLLIRAFEAAPPARLAPFSYAQLVWATLLSAAVFQHVPDAISLVGIGIIAAAGLFTALHAHFHWRGTAK
jgi:drug/metabolite transporter (DMT)-like permease